jgi:hypothetical protein
MFVQAVDLPNFDVYFSLIVLQHNHPGGIAYFQVPTYCSTYQFTAADYLASAGSSEGMEMHLIPQGDLFQIIADANCDVLEMREDNWAGPTMLSNSFLLRKSV